LQPARLGPLPAWYTRSATAKEWQLNAGEGTRQSTPQVQTLQQKAFIDKKYKQHKQHTKGGTPTNIKE